MHKKWTVADEAPKEFFANFPFLPKAVAQILWNRNVRTQEEADVFLSPDYSRDLHDPFLFRDMEKAVQRILRAIEKKEKIIVHGDYDSDGVCSSSLMMTMLEALGSRDHAIFLPHREKEGYGVNVNSVKKFMEDGVTLLITTDCGITNVAPIQFAQDNGIDVIITDHHGVQKEIPPAYAIIHPDLPGQEYPWKILAGVGSAFKLAQGLILCAVEKNMPVKTDRFGSNLTWEGFEKWLLDLVAIATITDMMPLRGENRVFVKYGLLVLNKTKRVGLQELIRMIQREKKDILDAWSVGFLIGPRLNATGRLDSSSPSFDILMSEDHEEARKYAEFLEEANGARQEETARIIRESGEMLKNITPEYLVSVMKPNWHLGVIGLSAGKLVNEFHLPAIVATEVAGEIRGSGRSIEGFHITEALEKLEPYFSRFGGHAGACGFTLKDARQYEEFVDALRTLTKEALQNTDLTPRIFVDSSLSLSDIDWNFYENLEKLEPHGMGNSRPNFLLENVEVMDCRLMGKNNEHVRFTIADGKERKTVVGFGQSAFHKEISLGEKVSLVVEVKKNIWNAHASLQLFMQDWKITSS